MKKYILLSFCIHSFLLLFWIIEKQTKPEGGNGYQKEYKDVRIIPKPTVVNIELVEMPKMDKDPKAPIVEDLKAKAEQCPNGWYGGLGIQTGYDLEGHEVITQVFPKYPADVAGLVARDIILSKSSDEIRGDPGTTITLKIGRNSASFTISIVRDKICYE